MMRYCLFLFVFCFSSIFSENSKDFKTIARSFEELTSHSNGVANDVPDDIRSRRHGPVVQKISISSTGDMRIQRSFSCLSENGKGAETTAILDQTLSLFTFREKETVQIRKNQHACSIRLVDGPLSWSIDVRKSQDVDKAALLLEQLIKLAPSREGSSPTPVSQLLREEGFRYLIVAPYCADVADGVVAMSLPSASSKLLCWVTKSALSNDETLLQESYNRTPLFIYPIDVLDESLFFTQPAMGALFFFPYTVGTEIFSSALSTNQKALRKTCEKTSALGVCFTKMPSLSRPETIVCRPRDEASIRKGAKAAGIDVKQADWIFPKVFNSFDCPPRGTTSVWFEGANESSHDVFRYLLHNKPITHQVFRYVFHRELPDLHRITDTKSCYKDKATIEDEICKTSTRLNVYLPFLDDESATVLRIALFTHELGGSFGPKADLGYNSWPIALSVAEIMGCSEWQKQAIQILVESPPILFEKKKIAKTTLAQQLLNEASVANEMKVPLGKWLTIKRCFFEILSVDLGPDTSVKEAISRIHKMQTYLGPMLTFGIPSGAQFFHGQYPTRRLYSAYLWEQRDPKHRDGVALKRRREKCERAALDEKKEITRHRFWSLVDKIPSLAPNSYLSFEGRSLLKAQFRNGRLESPNIPGLDDEVEAMFVVDEWGTMYIGLKYDGKDINDVGFNHASFFCGGSVSSAGKILFKKGLPVLMTDHSGHYRCSANEMRIAIQVLEKLGANIDQMEVLAGSGLDGEKCRWAQAKLLLTP